MAGWLRQSTASQEILLGKFVDSTDAVTAETALTIANTDIQIWKEGATTLANKNSGGATHISGGLYYAVLDATDTNTLGNLEVNVAVSGALAVRREYTVLPAMVYDSLVLGTDVLQTDVTQLLGTAWLTPGTAGTPDVNAKLIGATAQTGRDIGASVLLSAGTGTGQLDFTSGVVKANLAQILGSAITGTASQIVAAFTKWFNVVTPTGTVNSLPDAVAGAASGVAIVGSNMGTVTSVSGAVGSVTGNVGGNVTGSVGSVVGAVGSVTGAVGSVTGNVGGNVTGSVGSVATGGITAASIATGAIDADALAADAVAEIADGVWDEPTAGHVAAGSTGEAIIAAGGAGDPWITTLPGAYTGSQAGKILADVLVDTGTTLQAELDGIQADTEDIQARLPAALVSGRIDSSTGAMAANVITAAATAADYVTELQSGISTLDAAGIRTAVGLASANLDTQLAALPTDADVQTAAAAALTAYDLPTNAELAAAITTGLTTALTEGYRGTNATGSVRDLLYELLANITEFTIAGTTKTAKKLDGSTTAKTYTLNDGTSPTGITEAT